MGYAVRFTPPGITSMFVMLIITWPISTRLISHGTVAFRVILKSSSDTVTIFFSHVFVYNHVVSLQHKINKEKEMRKAVCVLVLSKFVRLHHSHATSACASDLLEEMPALVKVCMTFTLLMSTIS